jgi:hypothetical protein
VNPFGHALCNVRADTSENLNPKPSRNQWAPISSRRLFQCAHQEHLALCPHRIIPPLLPALLPSPHALEDIAPDTEPFLLTHHMPPPQHPLPQIHQIRDRVPPIPDVLVQLTRDQRYRLAPVEDETAGEPALGPLAQRGDDEFVLGTA